jgi:hypothetical protein
LDQWLTFSRTLDSNAPWVTSRFHQPRALFLTRLYLLANNQNLPQRHGDTEKSEDGVKPTPKTNDGGITVEPYFFEPIPKNYWAEPDFWLEASTLFIRLG